MPCISVMRMVEAGLVHKWKRDWFADSLLCNKSIVTESPKISVLDVQSVLYVGLIGFGLALIFLALEFLCHRHPKLRSWCSRVGESCVNGCEGEEESADEKPGSNGSVGQHALTAFQYNNNNREGTGGRGEPAFHSVFVVGEQGEQGEQGERGERGEEQRSSLGIFDFSSVEQRNRFLFDTVYSRPEDFGRELAADSVHPPGRERKGSKAVRISDDVKIST